MPEADFGRDIGKSNLTGLTLPLARVNMVMRPRPALDFLTGGIRRSQLAQHDYRNKRGSPQLRRSPRLHTVHSISGFCCGEVGSTTLTFSSLQSAISDCTSADTAFSLRSEWTLSG